MSGTRRMRRGPGPAGAVLLTITLTGVVACGTPQPEPSATVFDDWVSHAPATTNTAPKDAVSLAVGDERRSDGVVAAGAGDAVYNYAPTLLAADGQIRMWWCSQYTSASPAGDDILYAVADRVDGPYHGPDKSAPVAVLSGNRGAFDAVHTCDPSVIRVDGSYYMYYTGSAGQRTHGNAIGLVTSRDGVHWTRAGDGAAIVEPAHDEHRDNDYGAGQPAAVYLDGWFYLMFTDTTGADAGWNGAGQFVLRSTDPAFEREVQALGNDGFEPVSSTDARRGESVVDAFSVDLMWVDVLQAFAIAHETEDGTTFTFYNRDFSRQPYKSVSVPGEWKEGPGILRQPHGHAPISQDEPCERVPLDVVRATTIGEGNAPTALRHFGVDVTGVDGCDSEDSVLGVYQGVSMPSPVRTMDLVTAGALVRIERRSVAELLSDRVVDERPDVLDDVSVSARLPAGAPVLRTDEGDVGLLLDDTLWPVRGVEASELAERNDSPLRRVSSRQWEEYPTGATLG